MTTESNTLTAEPREPTYIARVRETRGRGEGTEEMAYLAPQFGRNGHLVGFCETDWTAEWLHEPVVQAQLAQAYRRAARNFEGCEPTPENADTNGAIRMAKLIWEERECDRFDRWKIVTRTITIEASF